MKQYAMFNYDFLFNDHFAKVSSDAKLLYVNMMFYSNEGFVANPISILDSMGYDKGVLQELIDNGEILTLNGRDEVFITSYYVHNHNFNYYGWTKTPFAQYWKGKIFIKRNRIATLRKLSEEETAPQTQNYDKPIQQTIINNQESEEDIDPNLAETIRIAKTPWINTD